MDVVTHVAAAPSSQPTAGSPAAGLSFPEIEKELKKLFQKLQNAGADTRDQVVVELCDKANDYVRELPPEDRLQLWEVLQPLLYELSASPSVSDNYAFLAALNALLTVEVDEYLIPSASRSFLFRLYNRVKSMLPSKASDPELVQATAASLGRIVKRGGRGSSFGERFLEFEVSAAIEFLAFTDARRLAGVLLLKELALNCDDTYFHPHVGAILRAIFEPLCDTRFLVREQSALLLEPCLRIIVRRLPIHSQRAYLLEILHSAQARHRSTEAEVTHGCFLAFQCLFIAGGTFMHDYFQDTALAILYYSSHRDPVIRRLVMTLIPTLAAYDSEQFEVDLLGKAMSLLIKQLPSPTDGEHAFVAIGITARATGIAILPFLKEIMVQAKIALESRGKKQGLVVSPGPVLQCLNNLAKALGPNMIKPINDHFELIINCPLSEGLVDALRSFVKHIRVMEDAIRERLLDRLCHMLSGMPYIPLGAPPSVAARNRSSIPRATDPKQIQLALSTLGSFDFTGHTLNEVVRSCAAPYLDSDYPEIRQAAAVTSLRILANDPILYRPSTHAIGVLGGILDKLITVAVSDPDPSTRRVVLQNLDLNPQFFKHLAQPENIRALFTVLNDEVFENRRDAVPLIGELAKHNPAYIVPSVRKTFRQLVTALEWSQVTRDREEATALLSYLIHVSLPSLKPYALSMFQNLIVRTEDPSPLVSGHVITCLGDLVTYIRGDLSIEYRDRFMEILLQNLSDAHKARRRAACGALGKLCQSTGYVIEPLIVYPQLSDMLCRMLQEETEKIFKRKVVSVLGILGALDPFKQRREAHRTDGEVEFVHQVVIPTKPGSVDDEGPQGTVFCSLLSILEDSTLSELHPGAVDAIMSIFKTQGLGCVKFIPAVIPAIIAATTNETHDRTKIYYLQQITVLIGIIGHHVREHQRQLMDLVVTLWVNNGLHVVLVGVVERIARTMDSEFKPYLPDVIPAFVRIFNEQPLDERLENIQMRCLDAIQAFGASIEEFIHLVLPLIVKSYERPDAKTQLRKRAIHTIEILARRVNLTDHSSRIVHPLVRVLVTSQNELRMAVMDTLCALLLQMGSDFALFVPSIQKVIEKHRLSHPRFETLATKLLRGDQLPRDVGPLEPLDNRGPDIITSTGTPAFPVNHEHLKQAWDTYPLTTAKDWVEWMHRFTVAFLSESPSPPLRACNALATRYDVLGKELLNPAFLSCWSELSEHDQEDLSHALEVTLTSPVTPVDVIHRVLDLAEYMEREHKALPIDPEVLGNAALAISSWAQALHYKELDYFKDSTAEVIESLLTINASLRERDAAFGTLHIAREQYDVRMHETWYEKLGKWQEALTVYESKLDHDSPFVQLGKIRCLHALQEWEELATVIDDAWEVSSNEQKGRIAPMAAATAWSLSEWDAMEDYVRHIPSKSLDHAYYCAVLSIHRSQRDSALQQLAKARDLLVPMFEGYDQDGVPYEALVRAQVLSELEEIVEYKNHAGQNDWRQGMLGTWRTRLVDCQRNVEVWARVLQIRSLVLKPTQTTETWIKFANLARKEGRFPLAEKTIASLTEDGQAAPSVLYSQLKYMWDEGKRDQSLEWMTTLVERLEHDISTGRVSQTNPINLRKLASRCYFKLGQWTLEMQENRWTESSIKTVLGYYKRATEQDRQWSKAWHVWALQNFDVVKHFENLQGRTAPWEGDTRVLEHHVAQAMKGFYESIGLRKERALQDILRLLTLWFTYGSHDKLSDIMAEGSRSIPIHTWVDVIPQLIARIQTPHANIRRHLDRLLNDLGREHPQALIFPLIVASLSSSPSRQNAAFTTINIMKTHSPEIVAHTTLVSKELARVAVLWPELWRNALEEASRLWAENEDVKEMLGALEPLYAELDSGGETIWERRFVDIFSKDLNEARELCNRYHIYNVKKDITKAWDIFKKVFHKLDAAINTLSSLELQNTSPGLLQAKHLDIAVPGTYGLGNSAIIKIQSFVPKLSVIDSKQKPRRILIRGDDGREYQYLLKGHEDLRQDERVMQFFTLVNTLLRVDSDSLKRQLTIQHYSIIPIGPNAGIISWVQGTQTLHLLVKRYRDARRILLNLEQRVMLEFAPEYWQTLTHIQQVEVFEYALENTRGPDLYRILWLTSNDSQHWVQRRATYTRTLAVSSMVGHILGLGDRHPSNILIKEKTGQVVHIDFGECFEHAMHREQFPEKMPFRLTRMLTHAMEVCGIEGTFRLSSEITMRILRNNSEALMAVLEALIYDPLINWRLFHVKDNDAADAKPQNPDGVPRTSRKMMTDESDVFNDEDEKESRNDRAVEVYERARSKLTGQDFDPNVTLDVREQVDRLIIAATSIENLCSAFSGWCAFW